MCGIAGILSDEAAVPDASERVGRMQSALLHRGPDDGGRWMAADGGAALAHTRLAVVDTTSAGRQPMSSPERRLTLVMNGEIYNFRELRRQLQGTGAVFQSGSDAEVVLRAYEAWGDSCVERLRGMFAIAIWDQRNQRCLLARDRFGIKPLYYAQLPGALIFASELRSILAAGLVAPEIDATAAYDYFRAGSVQEPRTLIAGVAMLPAGYTAVWHRGHLGLRCYWDYSFQPEIAAPNAVAATRNALLDSVQHHLAGDAPVGILLSGGVDSTALLALAAQSGRNDLRALTVALPGHDADESALARRTARHFGIEHHVCAIDAVTGRSVFEDAQRLMDQPSIDGMNTLAVSGLARSMGLKVVLSGLGADELFGGYPLARRVPKLYEWHRRLTSPIPAARLIGTALERLPEARCRRIGDMLMQPPALSAAYSAYRGIFTRAEAHALTTTLVGREPSAGTPERDPAGDSSADAATCRLDLTRYLRNQLLRDSDVMGMACGVEIRVPYIDSAVVNTLTRIAGEQRVASGKRLLRDAVSEIPGWITSQPKRGFMFPMDLWTKTKWPDVFDDVSLPRGVIQGPWYRRACVRSFNAFVTRTRAEALAAGSGRPRMAAGRA